MNGILFYRMARLRVALSWLIGLAAVIFALFSESRNVNSIWYTGFHVGGFILLIVGTMGRVWCALYISGNKNKQVCQWGPYSLCRNPLYVCSFLGLIGIALGLKNPILAFALTVFFWIYYTGVVRDEERHLQEIFGEEFAAYRGRISRFWPSLGTYQSTDSLTVNVKKFQRSLKDVLWFILIWALVVGVNLLRSATVQGQPVIPVLWKLPF